MALQLGQHQRLALQQRMVLAPQILQSIEILQLPLMALQERIDQELFENPLLEETEPEPAPPEEKPESPADRKADERVVEGEDFAKLDNLGDDFRDYFYQTSSRPAPGDKDEKMEALANTPGRDTSLQDHLQEQVRFLDLDAELRRAVEFLTHNLRRDGYLASGLDELMYGMEGDASRDLMELALYTLQTLDPPGVGARDLKECLLLQLARDGDGEELVERIIREHLEDVQMNRYPRVVRATGASMADVKAAVARIQLLDPAPGSAFDTVAAPYIIPDVLVEYIDGRYEVSLNDSHTPRLRVSPAYQQLLQQDPQSKETKEYVRKKLDSARWFIDSIQQRRNTLLKVARQIVRVQHEFFERGLGHLRPLKMQEVADVTRMHVTTVSRAIRGKHAQTPRGIFSLKFFFGGGVQTDQGESESFSAIRQRIVEIVDNEDKSKPLSDDQIVAALMAQGIEIARRTVTKYRKALNMPSSRQRKQY